MRSASLPLVALSLALAMPAAAQTIDATALEHEPGLADCGTLAIAGWVTFRVDRTVSGPAIARGAVIRVMVQCPLHVELGAAYRLVLADRRPTDGHWPMFGARAPPADDGPRVYWARSDRRLR